MFFFFKQKTAYDLRISDWTSYVCSSALWMGAPDSFEARVVPQHGFAIDFIRVSGLRGKGVLKLLQAPLLIARAVREALAILKSRQPAARSEEHTSELQSLMRISYAVFCLKKKQTKTAEQKYEQNE